MNNIQVLMKFLHHSNFNKISQRGIRGAARPRHSSKKSSSDEEGDDPLREHAEVFFNKGEFADELLKKPQVDQEKKRKTILFKIIQRKHFKPPQEKNLLTYSAKEQIRFLHQEYPEEWPLERLVENFPISRDGLIKILKAKWNPKTLHDLIRHDRGAQRNWLALKDNKLEVTPGSSLEKFKRLLNSKQCSLIMNALGTDIGPKPALNMFLPKRKNKNVGMFEAMVSDYCDQKALAISEKQEPQDLYVKHIEQNKRFLKDIIGTKDEECSNLTKYATKPANPSTSLAEYNNSSTPLEIYNESQKSSENSSSLRLVSEDRKKVRDFHDKVKIDSDINSTPYLYNEEEGYHNVTSAKQNSEVVLGEQNLDSSDSYQFEKYPTKYYKKGKSFFDEHGNFLFKTL